MDDTFRKLGRKPGSIISAGIAVILVSWCLDAALDTFVLKENSLLQEITAPSFHSLWQRFLTILLITLFIIYVRHLLQGRDRMAEELHQALLREHSEKSRAEGILAAIGDGVSIQDTNFRILYQNEGHKALVGGDYAGRYCYEAYGCRDQVCPECPVAVSLRDKAVHKVQKAASSPISATYLEITASPLFDADGTIIACIELLRDISESRQALDKLEESEQRFRNLVESTSDWVWEVDANGKYTYASPQIRDLLGYGPEEVVGRTPFDLMPPEEAQRIARIYQTIAAERQPIRALENINLHRDGHPVVLETSGAPVFDKDGLLCGFRGIDRDITERKQSESKIRALNEKLLQRAAQLAIANKELEAFSSSVSHDLRNPLTRMYTASQLLRDSFFEGAGEHCQLLMDTISEACENMGELIDALLTLSRVSCDDLNTRECDLSYIAGLVAAELQLADSRRLVEFTIQQGLVDTADQRLIKSLLENLIGNAWKYTQKIPEAHIEFGETEIGTGKVYFVRDNGAGFDMADCDMLFKPFKRLHNDADFKGTGIGLATVQRIVERHGGQVWADGEVGRGATFYFTLKQR